MAIIQFSHANGIPAPAYRYLLDQLAPHSVQAVPAFGLGSYRAHRGWGPLVAELIASIEAHGQAPVIGMGHSLGAVLTLRAAVVRPELFRGLIIMDPPLFGRTKRSLIGMVRAMGLAGRAIPIARNARRRRTHFDSPEAATAYWHTRPFFRRFHPTCFADYVAAALVPAPAGGYTLRIPAEVEYDIFRHTPYRIPRPPASLPVALLYPETGGVSQPHEQKALAHRLGATPHVIPGSHMFPLERPDETAAFLHSLLSQL